MWIVVRLRRPGQSLCTRERDQDFPIRLAQHPTTKTSRIFCDLAAPGAGVKCRISYPIKTFHACLFEVVSLYLENLPRNPLDLNCLLRDLEEPTLEEPFGETNKPPQLNFHSLSYSSSESVHVPRLRARASKSHVLLSLPGCSGMAAHPSLARLPSCAAIIPFKHSPKRIYRAG